MTLREARVAFTLALADLIRWGAEQGYELALDEVADRITEKDPTTDHMKGSLHEIGLAADLNLYIDGRYCADTYSHTKLGERWEQMGKDRSLPLTWGGRFTRPDGNHYSLSYQGRS